MGRRINDARNRLAKIQHLHDNNGNVVEATFLLNKIGEAYKAGATSPEAVQLQGIHAEAVRLVNAMKNRSNDDG